MELGSLVARVPHSLSPLILCIFSFPPLFSFSPLFFGIFPIPAFLFGFLSPTAPSSLATQSLSPAFWISLLTGSISSFRPWPLCLRSPG